MKIYVAHSSGFDYQENLYKPLKDSELNKFHEITLPHEKSTAQFNSKEYLKECDLVVAEVSYPSTGQGIELGWANLYDVLIICIFKSGTKPSSSIKSVTETFIEYENPIDMIEKLRDYLSKNPIVKL